MAVTFPSATFHQSLGLCRLAGDGTGSAPLPVGLGHAPFLRNSPHARSCIQPVQPGHVLLSTSTWVPWAVQCTHITTPLKPPMHVRATMFPQISLVCVFPILRPGVSHATSLAVKILLLFLYWLPPPGYAGCPRAICPMGRHIPLH